MVSKYYKPKFPNHNICWHLPAYSWWPFLLCQSLHVTGMGLVGWLCREPYALDFFPTGVATGLVVLGLWFRCIHRETEWGGPHNLRERKNYQFGFKLFMVSEAGGFLSLLWAFGHRALTPVVHTGRIWPPQGIIPVEPYGWPVVGAITLFTSGQLCNIAMDFIQVGCLWKPFYFLCAAIAMGTFFLFLQAWEYYYAFFTLQDRIYGSVFYLLTGFHAIHVIIGVAGLSIQTWRLVQGAFGACDYQGLQMSIWYWHFVDYV